MFIRNLENSIIGVFSTKIFFTDLFVAAFVYFLPALSHLTNFPLYIIEPMRIAVVFCLLNTNRKNALFIAVTVPLFSFFISSHPAVFKSLLIIAELLVNLIFFNVLIRKQSVFISMFLSIIISKIFYYSGKFILIQMNFIEGGLISSPIYIQWIIAFVLSLYAAVVFEKEIQPKT